MAGWVRAAAGGTGHVGGADARGGGRGAQPGFAFEMSAAWWMLNILGDGSLRALSTDHSPLYADGMLGFASARIGLAFCFETEAGSPWPSLPTRASVTVSEGVNAMEPKASRRTTDRLSRPRQHQRD